MAQLKDSVVSGSMRVTDTLYDDITQTRVLQIPTATAATTYGPGISGQVVKTNGTNAFWSTPSTESIGSASAGTDISADDITAWTTNTPTDVTAKTVVTSASGATATYADGILTITDGSFGTGDSVTVTAGSAASLSYTAKTIPNISITSKTVLTGV